MGRKQLITDSYPVVKRREGSAGHSKGELAAEPGLGGEAPLSPGEDIDEEQLEMLRQFDLTWQYGPCTGITRLQRWYRAEQMGLDPPLEVHQVLQSHPGDPRYQFRSEAGREALCADRQGSQLYAKHTASGDPGDPPRRRPDLTGKDTGSQRSRGVSPGRTGPKQLPSRIA
ncbi:DNA polymerase delta subunit 4 [Rhynchocyon petersi]